MPAAGPTPPIRPNVSDAALIPTRSPARPRLRGAVHAVAGGIAPIVAVALWLRATAGAERQAVVFYGITLTAMLVVSAAYHRGGWSVITRRRMKALDHTTIFAFIVGSYVPLAVITLDGAVRIAFLGSLTALALAGIFVKLRLLDRLGGPADVLYGIATWWALLILVPAAHALSVADLLLLFGGIVLYSVSAGCLGRRWFDRAPQTFGYHEVAHSVVVLAVACHYLLYWKAFG